jgi:hypothetical protein
MQQIQASNSITKTNTMFVISSYFTVMKLTVDNWRHGTESFLRSEESAQLVYKFPVSYGTRRFITVFTRARHWSLHTARWIQSTPSNCFPKIRFNIILPSKPGSYERLFISGFPTKIFYAFLPSPMRATCPTHLILLYLILIMSGRSQWPCGLWCGSWPVGCWNRGVESRSRHGCLSASFCVVLSCVGRGLATGWSLVQGVRPTICLNTSRNLLYVRRPRSFKDSRATGGKK